MREYRNKNKNKKRNHKTNKYSKHSKSQKKFRKKSRKELPKISPKISHEKREINCSPLVEGKTVNKSSCLTPELLVNIKNKYNNHHPGSLITSNNPQEIWTLLKQRFAKEKRCNNERCWLSEIGDKKRETELAEKVFAPDQPPEWRNNPDEWLSNFDIFNVLWQYQEKYPDFKFMGPTTIDFDTRLPEKNGQCVENTLCNFNLKKDISEGIQHFGCVFNLDKHWQSGSHWVSIYIDIPEKIIFFFDSAGASNTPNEIHDLVDRVKEQGVHLNPPIEFEYFSNTRNQHQKGNTECGMYSIFFIITMLTGKTPFYKNKVLSMDERIELFLKKKIPDEVVFDYRDLYFNPSP
jgi:hypothetical protein